MLRSTEGLGELDSSLWLRIEEGLRDMDWRKADKLSGCCGSKKYLDRLVLSESGWVVGVGDTSSCPATRWSSVKRGLQARTSEALGSGDQGALSVGRGT